VTSEADPQAAANGRSDPAPRPYAAGSAGYEPSASPTSVEDPDDQWTDEDIEVGDWPRDLKESDSNIFAVDGPFDEPSLAWTEPPEDWSELDPPPSALSTPRWRKPALPAIQVDRRAALRLLGMCALVLGIVVAGGAGLGALAHPTRHVWSHSPVAIAPTQVAHSGTFSSRAVDARPISRHRIVLPVTTHKHRTIHRRRPARARPARNRPMGSVAVSNPMPSAASSNPMPVNSTPPPSVQPESAPPRQLAVAARAPTRQPHTDRSRSSSGTSPFIFER
jgi:hypothetical protein